MKLQSPSSDSSRSGSPATGGFTLSEILIAVTVFMLLLAGIIAANLFGLRMFQVNQTKLSATEWSRNTFGKITDEIHTCTAVSVGNMTTNGFFLGLLPGEPQVGNAIEIQPTTNTDTGTFIHYFVDADDGTFRRTEPSSGTNTLILADSVTNTLVFSAQDFSGQINTNGVNNQIIHLTLEFYQPGSYTVGPAYCRLETSVSRRAVQ